MCVNTKGVNTLGKTTVYQAINVISGAGIIIDAHMRCRDKKNLRSAEILSELQKQNFFTIRKRRSRLDFQWSKLISPLPLVLFSSKPLLFSAQQLVILQKLEWS